MCPLEEKKTTTKKTTKSYFSIPIYMAKYAKPNLSETSDQRALLLDFPSNHSI